MQIGLKHLFLVAFLIAFAFGVRAFSIAIENDAATGIGVLIAAFLASSGFTVLATNRWVAWLLGVSTTTTMCVVDMIERINHSPALDYLWREPIQAQYAADPELGIIVTIVHTFFATIISGFGVGTGILFQRLILKSSDI